MAEYRCPKCGSEKITSNSKIVRGAEAIRVILCEDCGHFLGVVNDLSKIKNALCNIAAKVGTSAGGL